MRSKVIILLFAMALSSCSGFRFPFSPKRDNETLGEYESITPLDYADHLDRLGEMYLSHSEVKEFKLEKHQLDYLQRIYDTIISNNELLLYTKEKPEFHILVNRVPFHFSLPRSKFFISTGLILKYLKSEDLLISVLAFEIVKSVKNIYLKKYIVPTGNLSTERMLQLTRVDLSTRNELNKWSFYVLKRSGHDPNSYLNWLQTQNKNMLDFSMQHMDIRDISKEEYEFKNFLVGENLSKANNQRIEGNSSKDFYLLTKALMRSAM